ncbi:acyl-CoA dehydrogenase family protein [Ottowia thiooxydans]|uniref:acyl-CoA dehydrogenase family protein n=1 Tax=Ottowia thiooxydans TaxID=219182 RepID=UPI0004208DA8|nr:acyl-CoA dehydrogenase family protein [Ottowia thiooxydans]
MNASPSTLQATSATNASEPFESFRARLNEYLKSELIPLEKRLGLGYQDRFERSLIRSIWQRCRELGFYGAQLPVALGGCGLSIEQHCLLKDDAAASGAILFPHVLGDWGGPSRIGSLVKYLTPSQRSEYLEPVVHGQKGICFAMTEPRSGSDAASIQTSAVRDGDHYVINGRKHFITASTFADAAILMCVTDPSAGAKGISAVFVDLDAPGVRLDYDCVPMSGQFVDADIIFENVRVPVKNVIGQEGQGFHIAMNRINTNRVLHCPTMLGLARQTYELSLEYAQQRKQFGGAISRFQAIQHMLADMATSLYACEHMILATARKADRGDDIRTEASMCKLFVSERCFEVADKAVQIHGNVGVTQDHPVEFIFRRLRMYRIVTGTSEIQRNTIAKGILAIDAA